jgi:hypothetical protein
LRTPKVEKYGPHLAFRRKLLSVEFPAQWRSTNPVGYVSGRDLIVSGGSQDVRVTLNA